MFSLTHRVLTMCAICISVLGIMVAAVTAEPADGHTQYHTIPDQLPTFTVTVPAADVDKGYLFITPFAWGVITDHIKPYILILDDNAEPVYYKSFPNDRIVLDFHPQITGELTYFTSTNPNIDDALGYVMDDSYNIVRTVDAIGYDLIENDGHETILTEEGTTIMMIYARRTANMLEIVEGGQPNATLIDTVVQEYDANGNVLFEWSTEGNYLITETAASNDLTGSTIDYTHGNSVEIDTDGNLLIMVRDFHQVVKVNRQTEEIMWRLGGYNSDFEVIGDTEMFYLAHDARRLPNGNIQIFDNNNNPPNPPSPSRAVEYRLDEENMTVEQVWEYVHPYQLFAGFTGNAQRLPNGNTIISWGGASRTAASFTTGHADVTEVSPDGTIQFEMAMNAPYFSYRVFRMPWVGNPTQPPALVSEFDGTDISLYYSWNGATEVASYNIYGGTDQNALALIETRAKTGFEDSTIIIAPEQDTTHYYQVVPVDAAGVELLASDTIEILTTPSRIGLASHTAQPTLASLSVLLAVMIVAIVTLNLKTKNI